MAFSITSSAFSDGDDIPRQFTCEGADDPPPLHVSDPPAGTRSFVIIADDPDAPRGTFTHWLAYDIPAGSADVQIARGRTLRNSFGRDGYGGPCPPPGRPHRYFFKVYAVDVAALPIAGETKQDLEKALDGHTLARAQLMGRYKRQA